MSEAKRAWEKKWAVRTVRDGAVIIDGKTFRPVENHQKYDGRLDGHRFAFGKYRKSNGEWEDFICLWGTAEAFKNPEINNGLGPHLVDGAYPWEWWNETTPKEAEVSKVRNSAQAAGV